MINRQQSELTAMSGIAILFVLFIHGTSSAFDALYPAAVSYVEADLFLGTLTNLVAPAVPMFIFLSGYKYALHDRNTSYGIFLKKRLPRVLMSFLIINTFFWCIDSAIYMDVFDPTLLLKTYVSSWMGNTVAYPLWYIPMYCCVIIVCPLVMRVIRNKEARFILYLVLGIEQRYMAGTFVFLGKYPFMFLSYPVFFEMGYIEQEYNLAGKVKHKAIVVVAYFAVVVLLSVLYPQLAASAGVKYIFYYVCGTLVYYFMSILMQNIQALLALGVVSYPVFLFHEPVFGRIVGVLLKQVGCTVSWLYTIVWVVVTLTVTLGFIYLLRCVKVDRILWNFKLK